MLEYDIKINKKDIAYMQFILEGYEGMVTATTIDKKGAVVKLFVMPHFKDEMEILLNQLSKEIAFEKI
jgi:hypothetical protein